MYECIVNIQRLTQFSCQSSIVSFGCGCYQQFCITVVSMGEGVKLCWVDLQI